MKENNISMQEFMDDYKEACAAVEESGSVSGSNFFNRLQNCYHACIDAEENVAAYAKQMWDAYPYDDVDLNISVTRHFRGTWEGRALLFSLFSKTLITRQGTRFSSIYGVEYDFQNDMWIGSLRERGGNALSFVDDSGVKSCRDFFTSEKQVENIRKAVVDLVDIYDVCSWQEHPYALWAAFMAVFDQFSGSLDVLVFPKFKEYTEEKGCAHVLLSYLDRTFVAHEDLKEKSKDPVKEPFCQLLMKIAEPFGQFLDHMSDYLISY